MASRERRVSTRIRGLELNLLERSGLTNAQVVRYGLRKYYEEHPQSNEYMILTEIAFLRDKIEEYELLIDALGKSIEDKISELNDVRQSKENRVYWYIVKNVYDIYLDFLDDEGFTDEFRSDLKNFYTVRRDSISIVGLNVNKSYDEVISIFESYLEYKEIEDFVDESELVVSD